MKVCFFFLVTSFLICKPGWAELPAWEFQTAADLSAWVPNGHLAHVEVKDGTVQAEVVGWDPFFQNREVTIPAAPWQYVLLRIKADRPGLGELFWSGQLEGQYGGLSQSKSVGFSIRDSKDWQEIAMFPFWHTEGTIRQMRLDLYNEGRFEIDRIAVLEWHKGQVTPDNSFSWEFNGDISSWQATPDTRDFFAPPLRFEAAGKKWVTVQIKSDQPGLAAVLWAGDQEAGLKTEEFEIRGDARLHAYNLNLSGNLSWKGSVLALGFRPPERGNIFLQSIAIGSEPSGPAELEVTYFGFENGVNRAGQTCTVMARLTNQGGQPAALPEMKLLLPPGVEIINTPDKKEKSLACGEYIDLIWQLKAQKPGRCPVTLQCTGPAAPEAAEATLVFEKSLGLPAADYVPAPRPIHTRLDVCAYYFPGWETPQKWDCIRRVAPVRKPLLGYYDESNPQCVDWQIKWAAENGISCFLVDWYWTAGQQALTHWFEAYRKARYRDYLKVAIMWANHNPPDTHSVQDWLNVTQHWIDHYFNLKTYYTIDGKPAVFIWNPQGITHDLGGSQAVKETFEKSQQMARDAGLPGITFIAMGYGFTPEIAESLLNEGYSGTTTYHEWGKPVGQAMTEQRSQFDYVAKNSPAAWREKDRAMGKLTYYPVVDTGWDSRPWHGNKAMAIEGRSPELFEHLLREADTFCREANKPLVILAPVNEWGEGSYIEPNTEFGFAMYEAIRKIFCTDDPSTWPVNVAPADIGLGPYDYPTPPGTAK